jgi:uncharacterized protein (DUF2147 family)
MTQRTHPIFRPIRQLAPAVITALALASGAAKAQQPSPTLQEAGVWVNDLGDGAVEIYICQDKANRLCGRIVWLKEPLNAQGVPKHDRYNPNQAMQNRPICGLPVLGNLARDSGGGFDSGWIYDPKAGKSYDAAIRLSQRDQLVVTGYLGMKFMGKSFTWTRAPADLPRCNGTPPAQPINNGAAKPATPPGGAAASAAPPKAAVKPATSATAAAAPSGAAATKPASTVKAATTSKTTAAKTTTAAQATTAKTASAKAATTSAKATTGAKPTTAKTTTTAAVPKPKPAQKPADDVANANSGSTPLPQEPAAKSSAPKTIEADTATSWSN